MKSVQEELKQFKEEQAALQGDKVRSFFSQLYTSPTRGNSFLNGALNQGGFLTVSGGRERGA